MLSYVTTPTKAGFTRVRRERCLENKLYSAVLELILKLTFLCEDGIMDSVVRRL